MLIPVMNHVAFPAIVDNIYVCGEQVIFTTAVISNAKTHHDFLLIVGTIKNIKNKVYRYQYGERGCTNRSYHKLFTSVLTEPENITFSTHVIVENTKYGTPSASSFFLIFLIQDGQDETLLNFW